MVTYEQALAAAREKTREAGYGSPFRYELTRLAPAAIRRYCPTPADVLDVGCGSGRYALFFIEAGVTGSYTGVDISDERWHDLPLPAEFPGERRRMDAIEIDRIGRSFDFVISLTAFEHFADDKQVAWGIARVMKPGAHMLLAVPAPASYPLYGPHGFRRYSADDLRALAEEAGLRVVELRKVGGLAGWLFHFNWFFPAAVWRFAVKAVLYALVGGNREAARQRWPRLMEWLDSLGQYHLRCRFGRFLHRLGLRLASRLDPYLPILEVGWLAVLRRD
jgi:SAM-dependent methyltransferase